MKGSTPAASTTLSIGFSISWVWKLSRVPHVYPFVSASTRRSVSQDRFGSDSLTFAGIRSPLLTKTNLALRLAGETHDRHSEPVSLRANSRL